MDTFPGCFIFIVNLDVKSNITFSFSIFDIIYSKLNSKLNPDRRDSFSKKFYLKNVDIFNKLYYGSESLFQ
ncbi:hypothetical protein BpHYR1_044860 [Brachionus plicatilis]|uniref:Uncharacterized protein n=1 Tax=Brachionus plicatilis TaxID=10195 RepID=A0A3M7P6Z6_BRAPC|nr:hypothetical protein BpHYR1_044860 [Brachionus plicatilis]